MPAFHIVVKLLMLRLLLANLSGLSCVAAYDFGYHPSAEEFDSLLRDTRSWTRDLLAKDHARVQPDSYVPRYRYPPEMPKSELDFQLFSNDDDQVQQAQQPYVYETVPALPEQEIELELKPELEPEPVTQHVQSQLIEIQDNPMQTIESDARHNASFPIYFTNPATGIVYAISEVGANTKSQNWLGAHNDSDLIAIYVTKQQYDADLQALRHKYEQQCPLLSTAAQFPSPSLSPLPSPSSSVLSSAGAVRPTALTTARPQIIRLQKPKKTTANAAGNNKLPPHKPPPIMVPSSNLGTISDQLKLPTTLAPQLLVPSRTPRPKTKRGKRKKKKKPVKRRPGHKLQLTSTTSGPQIVVGKRTTHRPPTANTNLATQLEKPHMPAPPTASVAATVFNEQPFVVSTGYIELPHARRRRAAKAESQTVGARPISSGKRRPGGNNRKRPSSTRRGGTGKTKQQPQQHATPTNSHTEQEKGGSGYRIPHAVHLLHAKHNDSAEQGAKIKARRRSAETDFDLFDLITGGDYEDNDDSYYEQDEELPKPIKVLKRLQAKRRKHSSTARPEQQEQNSSSAEEGADFGAMEEETHSNSSSSSSSTTSSTSSSTTTTSTTLPASSTELVYEEEYQEQEQEKEKEKEQAQSTEEKKETQSSSKQSASKKRIKRRPTVGNKNSDEYEYDEDDDRDNEEDEDEEQEQQEDEDNESSISSFFRMIFYPVQLAMSRLFDGFTGQSSEQSEEKPKYPSITLYHSAHSNNDFASDGSNDDEDDGEAEEEMDSDTESDSDSTGGSTLGSWFSYWFGGGRRTKKIGSTTAKPPAPRPVHSTPPPPAPLATPEPEPTGWLESWFGFGKTTTQASSSEEDDYDKWFSGWFDTTPKPKARRRKTTSTSTTSTTSTTTTMPQIPILTIVDPLRNPQNWIGILAHHIVNATGGLGGAAGGAAISTSTSTSSTTTNPLMQALATRGTSTTTTPQPDLPRRINYDKYQIWRLKPQDESQVRALEEFKKGEDGNKMQWLKGPSLRGLTDVLVPPKMLVDFQGTLNFEGIAHEVLIFDVGKAIAYERTKEQYLYTTTRRPSKHPVTAPPMTWNKYYEHDDILKYLETIRMRHTQLVELIHIGRSFEGRPLIVVKIESKQTAAAASAAATAGHKHYKHKRRSGQANAVFIEAGSQGLAWIGPATATWIIGELLRHMRANKSDVEHEFIRNTTWYIMPLLNPDGYVYSHEYDRFWKKSRSQHMAKAAGGLLDSAMTWLQQKRAKDKVCYGVDLDRNWLYHWGKRGSSKGPCNEFYAGPAPFSEPETRAVSEFLMDYRTQIKVSFLYFCRNLKTPTFLYS